MVQRLTARPMEQFTFTITPVHQWHANVKQSWTHLSLMYWYESFFVRCVNVHMGVCVLLRLCVTNRVCDRVCVQSCVCVYVCVPDEP